MQSFNIHIFAKIIIEFFSYSDTILSYLCKPAYKPLFPRDLSNCHIKCIAQQQRGTHYYTATEQYIKIPHTFISELK